MDDNLWNLSAEQLVEGIRARIKELGSRTRFARAEGERYLGRIREVEALLGPESPGGLATTLGGLADMLDAANGPKKA